jgi:hypothetical protein
MTRLIATLALLVATFSLSYVVMTRAWGLTLQSPAWFIAGGLGHLALYGLITAIQKEDR